MPALCRPQRGKPPIQATGAFQTEDQIRRVMVDVTHTGQPVYIGDLANVQRVYKDPTQYARSRGERAILLSVEMQEGNNIVDFGKELHASLDGLRPLLPPDLKLDMVADQPKVVAERVKDFIREFGIAIGSVILVTIVLLPFRVALVSAVAIPVTISATFGLLNAFGIELHQVSIAALIVVLGMVVDDAIVIADNYIELLDQGLDREEAAWRSATELAIPVLTATLTIICSFLPFLTLSGTTGEFIRALPLTVAIALATSFIVAMLLTPMLCHFFIRKGLHNAEGVRQRNGVRRLSSCSGVQPRHCVAMRAKPVALAAGVLAVIAGALRAPAYSATFLPLCRARSVRGRRLASGRLESGSHGCRGAADRSRAAAGEGGRQLHLSSSGRALRASTTTSIRSCRIRTTRSCWSRPRRRKLRRSWSRALRPKLAQAAPGSACLPARTAAGTGPGSGHRSPAHGRRRQCLAVLGQPGCRTCSSALQARWTCIATGGKMPIA